MSFSFSRSTTTRSYGVHVYGTARDTPHFLKATSLYHPDTVARSLAHDGSGAEPGLKDPDGRWDLRPTAIASLTCRRTRRCATWHAILESDAVPVDQSRMVYTVNRATAAVLDKLVQRTTGLASSGLEFSRGWDETIDRTKGLLRVEWGAPQSWDDVILQGPHLYVATPFYKSPNETMLHNQDWSAVDFEASGRRRNSGHGLQTRRRPRTTTTAPTRTGATTATPKRPRPLPRRMASDGCQHGRTDPHPSHHPTGRSARSRRVRPLGSPTIRDRDLALVQAF